MATAKLLSNLPVGTFIMRSACRCTLLPWRCRHARWQSSTWLQGSCARRQCLAGDHEHDRRTSFVACSAGFPAPEDFEEPKPEHTSLRTTRAGAAPSSGKTSRNVSPKAKAASVSISSPVRDRLRMTTADSAVAERAATSSRSVRRFVRLRSVVSTGSAMWASKDLTTTPLASSHRPATLNIAFSPAVFGRARPAWMVPQGHAGLV